MRLVARLSMEAPIDLEPPLSGEAREASGAKVRMQSILGLTMRRCFSIVMKE